MRRIVLALLMAGCGSAAEVSNTPSNQVAPSRSGPPDLAELRNLIGPHRREAFTKESVDDRACSVMPTLGAYVDYLEKADDPSKKVTGGCREFGDKDTAGVDPPRSPDYWFCAIDAIEGEGTEALWHYMLWIRVRKSDRSLDVATAGCPGTP
ncbi:MAG: hypothetical protein QM831_44860 [Kofleriaceae bacterium]